MILTFLALSIVFVTLTTPVLAIIADTPEIQIDDSIGEIVSVTYTDLNVEAEIEHERQLQEQLLSDPRMRCATCVETRSTLVRTSHSDTGFRRAGNQLSGGHIFNTRGSGFMFNGNGGPSFSFSLGLGWGPASISLSAGDARAGVMGVLEIVPNSLIGVPVALFVDQRVEVREYRIYERPRAKPNALWTFVRTGHTTAVIRRTTQIRRN